jgi:membrane protein implicated in regulation of membrane protease activity
MGIFSAIGGAISSVCSHIGGAISSLCSHIGGSLFTGASGIGALATSLIPTLAPGISEVLFGLTVISAIVSTIAEALGLKDKEETPEELGMKAEKSDKKMEDFDTTEEYIEHLRNDIEIDKKEIENLSDEKRATYMAIGSAITIKGIEEKYGVDLPGEFFQTVADRNLKGKEVHEYIKGFKENGITNMKDVSNYLNGKDLESNVEPSAISDSIIDTMKKLEPGISEDEIAEKFNSMIQVSE